MKKKELRALITLAGTVDPSLQAAMLKATKESEKASRTVKKHWGALGDKIKSGALKIAKGLGAGLMAGAAAASAAFAVMGAAGLQYASDLTEVQNVVDVTFGEEGAAVIEAFSKTSLESFGLSQLEAKKYSSTLGAMLKSMGLTEDQTLVMSQNMTALAGDMASFYNLSGDEAFDKIRAGLSGETEPLKQLGINMSVANMEAYALSEGISKPYSKMSQSEQTLLRYNYLLKTAADSQGDFSRTSDSFANQQKLLKANLQQTAGEIMSNMTPALAEAMQSLNKFIKGLDTQQLGAFAGELASMAAGFLPLVMDLLPSFGSLLKMALPPLMEIGQALIPPMVSVVGALAEAMEPILPVFTDFVMTLLPPFCSMLKAVSPLISALGRLLASVLAPALKAVASYLEPVFNLISKIAEPLTAAVNGIAKLTGGDKGQNVMRGAISMAIPILPAFANGGLATRPSIFGEVPGVAEMAIPIIPGSPRSAQLLEQTAKLLKVEQYSQNVQYSQESSYCQAPQYSRTNLYNQSTQYNRTVTPPGGAQEGGIYDGPRRGVMETARPASPLWVLAGREQKGKEENNVQFTYAPVIHATNSAGMEKALKSNAREVRQMIEDILENRGRFAWS